METDDESDISGDYDHPYVDYALDSLWENDMLEAVPVVPGERSLYEDSLRAHEPFRKRAHSGLAPSAPAPAVMPSWRRAVFLKK